MWVYDEPTYFDIAFQHRDIGRECDFLESVLELHSKTDNRRILDMYCGTGAHIKEMMRRGYQVDGFEISDNMIKHLKKTIKKTAFEPIIWKDNIENFSVENEYGLVTNMLTSFNYITLNEDVISHLESVAKALSPGGIYVAEMNHPRDLLSETTSAPNTWIEQKGNIEIEVDWNYKKAPLDYINQVYNCKGMIKVKKDGKEEILQSEEQIRIYLFQEIKALIALSGWLTLVKAYGAFNIDQPLNNEPGAWRMILVMRKD